MISYLEIIRSYIYILIHSAYIATLLQLFYLSFLIISMGPSISIIREESNRNRSARELTSLPDDMLTEVLSLVASSSLVDLFNLELSCRDLYLASQEKYILQKVSMEKFPAIPWTHMSDKAYKFLKRCRENGNPEALYRQGVVEYFSSMKIDSGFDCLKLAYNMRHLEASYVLGIILLCRDGDSFQKGLDILKSLYKSTNTIKLRECRRTVSTLIRTMWIRNYINPSYKADCTNKSWIPKTIGWPSDEEIDLCCENCKCYEEVVFFCKMLRGESTIWNYLFY